MELWGRRIRTGDINWGILSIWVVFKAIELGEVVRGQRVSGAGKDGEPLESLGRPLVFLFWVWKILHLPGL